MGKSTFFTGQPVLNQLLNLIDRNSVKALARAGQYDRYYRYFDTHTHLVTMLYCVLNKCTSSREVVSGMKACSNKLEHAGIQKAPGRSTLCDANMKRSYKVFELLYEQIYRRHKQLLPDSRSVNNLKLFIADASTITLFQQILKAPSPGKFNGKRKGGIKVHTLIDATDDVAIQVSFTAASANDMTFLKEINLEAGSFIVFDKGYVDYSQYERLTNEGVFFVTRQKKDARYVVTGSNEVSPEDKASGIIADRLITLGTRTHRKKIKLKSRQITFFDKQKARKFEFLTNNFSLSPLQIADLYRKRWQIEILFKRIKQNFPLKYFLGDNENAIKIQIWGAFIADLLIKLVQVQLKRKWAFSNLSAIIRLHLMSYIHLFNFLNDPERLSTTITGEKQLKLGGSQFGFKT
ncbi:IS4 family transposase [Mucilaginibacter jinjuensis]|uniref:IS4 family transposase n=1 Tax=Mucilaginibacter jinjuensis TaxID=1176721 RepID=A0ABY7T460_9SPHI|nr:IS4 family transposase [Mucilaginibacter jinjuensis]WCT11058.1 IS4 family transposase [Mucilaginibacter jinjuensis]WCT11283.1 IS4 family transposase [Mucilaginibacter jinjuensis]WCT14726.1 IS4 family transposase [Mucilaginibacter jinjuensis]